jgi:hypothetical protein
VSGRFPLLRGLIVVLVFTCGIPLISLAIFRAAEGVQHNFMMNTSFGILLMWIFLFLPHLAIVGAPFSTAMAVALAVSQWASVGVGVGYLTRSKSHWRALPVAIIAIAAVALAAHALIRVVGYRVIVEGP